MVKVLAALGVILLTAGCASPVTLDYSNTAHFSQYHSYAFKLDLGPNGALTLDQSRIESAARDALNIRGYKEVPADQADMLVRFHMNIVKSVDNSGVGMGFGTFHHPWGFGMMVEPPARIIRQKQLVVEVEDAKSHQIVWSATSQRLLDPDMTGPERTQRINGIVNQMFARFPP